MRSEAKDNLDARTEIEIVDGLIEFDDVWLRQASTNDYGTIHSRRLAGAAGASRLIVKTGWG